MNDTATPTSIDIEREEQHARVRVALSVLSDCHGADVSKLRDDATTVLRQFLAPPMIVKRGKCDGLPTHSVIEVDDASKVMDHA